MKKQKNAAAVELANIRFSRMSKEEKREAMRPAFQKRWQGHEAKRPALSRRYYREKYRLGEYSDEEIKS